MSGFTPTGSITMLPSRTGSMHPIYGGPSKRGLFTFTRHIITWASADELVVKPASSEPFIFWASIIGASRLIAVPSECCDAKLRFVPEEKCGLCDLPVPDSYRHVVGDNHEDGVLYLIQNYLESRPNNVLTATLDAHELVKPVVAWLQNLTLEVAKRPDPMTMEIHAKNPHL